MPLASPFEIPAAGLFYGSYLAEIVSVNDPEQRTRVQVRLLNFDGLGEQDGPVWARVAVPFAGANRGAFLIPDVGDEVLVTLLNGDPRLPIVIGGLWNGSASAPETVPGSSIDRWTIVGKAGTRIAIVEESASQATISLTTPGGVSGTLTDSGGGKIELQAAGSSVTIDAQGVSIRTGATVKVDASLVEVKAGMVKVDAAMAKFSGTVQCQVLIAPSVVGSTYTPGAGNIW